MSILEIVVLGWVMLTGKSQMRDVYHAIADPTRRKLLRLLANAEELPLHALTVHFQMGRTAVSKHLAVLKDAGLVTERRVGRETLYRLNATPLREIQDWVSYYEKFWKERMIVLNADRGARHRDRKFGRAVLQIRLGRRQQFCQHGRADSRRPHREIGRPKHSSECALEVSYHEKGRVVYRYEH